MKVILAGLWLLVGCAEGDGRATTYFTEHELVYRWFHAHCAQLIDDQHETDPSLPDAWAHRHTVRCRELDRLGIAFANVTIIGERAGSVDKRMAGVRRICGVEISGAAIVRPVDLGFLRELFVDPELAENALRALDAPSTKIYRSTMMLSGLRVTAEQSQDVDGPHLFVMIDGCGRRAVKDSYREVFGTLEFAK